MRGLIIRKEPLDEILAGRKTWEIRGSNAKIRGPIALIRSGSGLVVGRCKLIGVVGPLTLREYNAATRKHRADSSRTLPYPKTYAWILSDSRRLRTPIPYRHKPGAVRWINLSDSLFS